MKKITFILLLALLPTYNTFADQSQATHKLDVGAFGGTSVGGSIGLQSQWAFPWIAMINSFSFTNVFDTAYMGAPIEKPKNPTYIRYLSYDIGMRVFLGTPYIFFDASVGIVQYLNQGMHPPIPRVLGALGVNVPLTDKVNLQLSFIIDAFPIIVNLAGKVGIQFTL